MLNYEKMYAILCGAISDALDEAESTDMPGRVQMILQNAILATEEIYISNKDN